MLTVFAAGDIEQGLLIRVLTNESVNRDLLALPNSMATRHGLQVILQTQVPCYNAIAIPSPPLPPAPAFQSTCFLV